MLWVRTSDKSRVRSLLITTPECCSRAMRQDLGRYSAGASGAAAGYQIQTTTSRLARGNGESSSVTRWLTQFNVVRPTANWPVGVGNVISVLCSRQSKTSRVVRPTRPNITKPAKPWMRRLKTLLARGELLRAGAERPDAVRD